MAAHPVYAALVTEFPPRAGTLTILEQAGLPVVSQSHLGWLPYPAFAFVKHRNRRWLEAPEHIQQAVVERDIRGSAQGPFLRWATAIEEWLGRWVNVPIGIRCVAVAIKPATSRQLGHG